MTSLLLRKLRTTVPRTRVGTGFSLALLLTLVGGSAYGQQPGRPPTPRPAPTPGAAGTIMYFHKPANALAPTSGNGGSVAKATEPTRPVTTANAAVTEVPATAPQSQPEPWKPASPLGITQRPVPAQPTPTVVQAEQQAPPQPVQVVDPIPVAAVPVRTASQLDLPKNIPVDPSATNPPPRQDVFAMPNDARLEEVILSRLRAEEGKRKNDKGGFKDPYARYPLGTAFPKITTVGGDTPYVSKTATYPPMQVSYEAIYVVHRRMGFEEKNAERYGWDLGFIQPLVSTLYFYKDVLLWPNSLASSWAYGCYDTNAGKCLPGSPTPYYFYPPGLTITGTVAEGLIITGAAFAFP